MVRITHPESNQTVELEPRDAAIRIAAYEREIGSRDGLVIESDVNLALYHPSVPDDVRQLFEDLETKYGRHIDVLVWRVSRSKRGTSGITYPGKKRIVITQGYDPVYVMAACLHEFAHLLAPGREHHGEYFYRECFNLFHEYLDGENLKRAIESEWSYMKSSWWWYHEWYKPEVITQYQASRQPQSAVSSLFGS